MNTDDSRSVFNFGLAFKITLIGIVAYLCFFFYQRNAEGSGWASLNAAMAHHQNDPDPLSPVIVRKQPWSSYILLGWPSHDPTTKYEWIILDSTPGGNVMRTPPEGQFTVTCSYLAELESQVAVHRNVHEFLATHCLNHQ